LKQLGKMIGRSHASLSQIENAVHVPERATLIALAKALESNFGELWLDEFLEGNQGAPSKEEIVEDMSVREFVTLKFGGKEVRRTRKEVDALVTLLDAEVERIKREGF